MESGCRKRRSAKGVRSLFLVFWDSFGHFLVTSSDASVMFFVNVFCQTPFAGLLLRQGDGELQFKKPSGIVMGKSLDSPEKGNVDKMSENVEKCLKNIKNLSGGTANAVLGTFFLLFGRCFCLVTLSNVRPLQVWEYSWRSQASARHRSPPIVKVPDALLDSQDLSEEEKREEVHQQGRSQQATIGKV